MSDGALISVQSLRREYAMGAEVVHALRGVDIDIQLNEYVAIMGPSGSGKSTLMNILGCLDIPTAGTYWLNGVEVSRIEKPDKHRGHIALQRLNGGEVRFRNLRLSSL